MGCRSGSASRSSPRARRSASGHRSSARSSPGTGRPSGGTTEETQIASTSAVRSRSAPAGPRSARRSRRRSRRTRSRKRQCSTSSSPRKAPRWVWVLPTSIASSIGRLCTTRRRSNRIRRGGSQALRDPGLASVADRQMMLESKGIPYKRIDLMPVISKGALRAFGFPGQHGPGAEADGTEGPGVARDRPRARPDPARPAAAAGRPRAPRRGRGRRGLGRRGAAAGRPPVLWNALRRDRSPLASYSEGARLGSLGLP